MKKTNQGARDLVDLGRTVVETKGATGDVSDDFLKRPISGGLSAE